MVMIKCQLIDKRSTCTVAEELAETDNYHNLKRSFTVTTLRVSLYTPMFLNKAMNINYNKGIIFKS